MRVATFVLLGVAQPRDVYYSASLSRRLVRIIARILAVWRFSKSAWSCECTGLVVFVVLIMRRYGVGADNGCAGSADRVFIFSLGAFFRVDRVVVAERLSFDRMISSCKACGAILQVPFLLIKEWFSFCNLWLLDRMFVSSVLDLSELRVFVGLTGPR